MLCTSLINLARSASDSVSIESEIGIADVALLVDSSDYEGSFRSVRSFWHPFLSLKRPDLRVILAGSKVDLRSGDNVRSIDSSQKIFDAWLVFLFPPPFEGQSSDKPSTSPVQSDASCMHINTARVLEYLLGLT